MYSKQPNERKSRGVRPTHPRPDAIANPSVTAVNTSVNECSAAGNCVFIVSDTSVNKLDPPT